MGRAPKRTHVVGRGPEEDTCNEEGSRRNMMKYVMGSREIWPGLSPSDSPQLFQCVFLWKQIEVEAKVPLSMASF